MKKKATLLVYLYFSNVLKQCPNENLYTCILAKFQKTIKKKVIISVTGFRYSNSNHIY